MKRIVCSDNSTLAHKSLDEMQIRIEYLQNVKDKLEAKGAILIEGPKWCGKTTTALQVAIQILP